MKLKELDYPEALSIDQELRAIVHLVESEMDLQGSRPLWLPYILRVRIRRAMKYLRAMEESRSWKL